MTPTTILQASTTLLAQLTNPAARALVLAAAAGLALAACRIRATSVRLFTWTTVLYAALALPLLQWMLPQFPVPTPAFLESSLIADESRHSQSSNDAIATAIPQTHVGTAALGCPLEQSSTCSSTTIQPTPLATQTDSRIATAAPLTNPEPTNPAPSPKPSPPASFQSALRWQIAAAALYFSIAMLLLTRFFVGLAFTRRLIRASRTIDDGRVDDPRVTEKLAGRESSVFVHPPRVAESDFISAPVTVGALRSTILLPSTWRDWDDPKLDAVLAHELSHVTRRDALTQRLSLLHRSIFWFSPLAWWLDRHLATLAEQAADEAALSCGTDRKHYARILLGFFEAVEAAPGRVRWQGVSMAHVSLSNSGQAEKRLERILSWKGSVAMRFKKSIASAVVLLAIPVVYLVAAANPVHHIAPPTATPIAQPAPDQTPSSAAAPDSAPAPAVEAVTPPTPAPAAVAPAPPVAPSYSQAGPRSYSSGHGSSHGSGHGSSYSFGYGYDENQRFVIVTGKSDSLTMSGDVEDAHHVEKLRKNIPGDFIWFERDEKSYVIRDQATIDRAKKFWAPQEELGKKQEALGKQQEILGKQQEELGSRMEQVHVKVPDLTAALDSLKAKLQKLGSTATMEQIGDLQSEIGELQSKIGEIQSQAGEQQGKLGEQQGALGEKQGKLGEEQGKLGEQQAKLAQEANRQMKLLLDEAIKNGTAQPEL